MTTNTIINDKFMDFMKVYMEEMRYEMNGINFHDLVEILPQYWALLYTREEFRARLAYILACHWGSNTCDWEEDFSDEVLDYPNIGDVMDKYQSILEGDRIIPYQYKEFENYELIEGSRGPQYFKKIVADTSYPEKPFLVSRDIYTLLVVEAKSRGLSIMGVKEDLIMHIRSLKHVNYRIGEIVDVLASTAGYGRFRLRQEDFYSVYQNRRFRPLGKL